MLDLDEQLFGEHNPLSFLRKCAIHFISPSAQSVLAKIYGALICDINQNPTHIVVQRGMESNINLPEDCNNTKVVYEEWLDTCFDEKKLVCESEYLVQG